MGENYSRVHAILKPIVGTFKCNNLLCSLRNRHHEELSSSADDSLIKTSVSTNSALPTTPTVAQVETANLNLNLRGGKWADAIYLDGHILF